MQGRVIYDQPTAVAAISEAFAEQFNEWERAIEGYCPLNGGACAVGTNAFTVKVNAGYDEFDGLLTSISAQDNLALTADGTNDRWALVEVDSGGTAHVTLGAAATSPELPAQTDGRVVHGWVYIPANATAVELWSGNTTNDGKAKLLDARLMHRRSVSGWTADFNTWVFSSSTAFTISSTTDYTGRYKPGFKVRWNDGGGVKYGHVASSTFTGGNTTTVNLVANSDYSMANSLVAGSFFFCDSGRVPSDFPDWFNYNPSPVGWGGSPPASTAYRFKIQGRFCTVVIRQAAAATSTTTTVQFTAPIVAATVTNGAWIAMLTGQDSGTTLTSPGNASIVSAASTINGFKNSATGAWTASGNKFVNFILQYEI